MKKIFTDEKTGIDYTLVGDVYLPNLVSADTNYPIGIWGQRHKEHLKENHKLMYFNLLTQGKLNSYLHDVDVRAKKIYDNLVTQLAEQEGVTEQLKATDMLAWVQAMNNISNCAREIVHNEIIYNF
ncbi:TnpV protein [Eubacterium coprostanoligenes]|uniref:TnpV protein n=1 Tax=Eubacterium coprostanoligenes TaxID=290054 RepID=UPI00235514EA|nr:TnpV protein [Eubacterium coprostanoligenes]MCI6254180.1 TnpV protein [Eubacterium coprostanoligenes]MDY5400920.1 TnpV protein [Eubacterium coprostanoligenes]